MSDGASRHPLIPARAVDPARDLPELELEVLERWRERDVFRESLRARADAPRWVFYEGPPTANGPPGAHHVLARVFKDIYPRFQTMRGRLVERKGGWDCHGLPVEIAVEQELGFTSKADIERYGIAKFNAKCRESVFAYLQEWDRLTERIGFWIDLDDAYRTLDESYIESVWWALAEIDRRGLLYEGHKVVPYCYRCGTALSSHEVALGYQEVVDRSVFVRLPIDIAAPDLASPLREGDELLIWTTTPWTLPGNVAVAVGPEIEYARARYDGATFVLAAALVARVLGEHAEILERFPGSRLVGAHYQGPIFPEGPFGPGERGAFPVVAGEFVTTDDGTGLVHIAPAFGEDDFNVAAAAREVAFDPSDPHSLFNPVRPDGTYDGRVRSHDGGSYEGRHVKDPQLTSDLIEDLRARGLLLVEQPYEHSYPHCWRCGTPLIYYAKSAWYIRTTALRDQMLAANETITWHPEHVKHGRFGDWLANNVDWALSRERYWGTPLPVWRCADGHTHTIGSFAELGERTGVALEDHHRPFVDEVQFACPECERPMRRVSEVIDVWFDSGSMPFAQYHDPFENHETFTERFPADFICEAQDQTRGWFYSLLAISVLLGREAPYRNVVCLGLILDGEGQKMSKSKGNAVEPWQVLEAYGADAFRWYFFTSKQPWDGYRFSEEAIAEGVRLFLKQLWSTYYFYVLYARAAADVLADAPALFTPAQLTDLDRWALSRTESAARFVAARLDAYDATSAGRTIAELVDELSNWYVRRSRARFWDGDLAAFQTLRTCLLAVARMLAPLCPFIADEIYDNLDGTLASVHLCDFPKKGEISERDELLEWNMALARETVRLGLGARGRSKVKIRQPLAEAVVVASEREREAIEGLAEVVRAELNVHSIRFVEVADELGTYEIKPNYRTLGPRFGKDMPMVAAAVAALEPAHVASALRTGSEIGIAVNGHDHSLTADDLLLTLRPPEGYSVEREGTHAVALNLTLDDDLRREGRAREIVHAVQNARKNAGLRVEDRIELWLAGDPQLIEAASAHSDYLTGETLALELSLGNGAPSDGFGEQAQIDGLTLSIALRKTRAH
ncbi:MAG TPA: isoleucine--tRNA ligase [Solirubrobacteraceae bacterium]|nr:isoleucine--tRNA ligase [Solirubrobacteraceae bacterium]